MCLYIGKNLPLVAEKDIIVYKYVDGDNGKYRTPYQDTPVTLNKTLVADHVSEPCEEMYNGKHAIGAGAIHACLTTKDKDMGSVVLKAIVKAGTKFYVQDDFTEIAATELFITDEEIISEIDSPDLMDVVKLYIETARKVKENSNSNGIFIGDFCLSNKTYVSPLSDFNQKDVIGVVAYFDGENNPVIISLEEVRLPWLTNSSMNNKVCSNIDSDKKTDDLNGKKHTYDIAASKDYDPDKFKAVAYCTNYQTKGTKEGDWYLGAIGECIKVAQNMGTINASIILKGVGDIITFSYMWSSSEVTWGGSSCAWGCYLDDGHCYNYCNHRDNKGLVRPFSAFINGAKA